MATLNLWNYFSLDTQGGEKTGKQGTSTDGPLVPFALTVDGTSQSDTGTLATATVRQIWASASDFPTTFNYFHFWADQDCYLQFVSGATNFTIKVEAKVPFVMPGFGTLLAAANTTAITGGTEPTLAAVATINLGNYSGSTLNYVFSAID